MIPSSRATGILLATALVPLVALGTLWWRDRSAPREEPRWGRPGLIQVFPSAGTKPAARSRSVVPVNPACPHCGGYVAAAAKRVGPDEVLAILMVDTRRPQDGHPAPAGVDEIWWDRDMIWRNRWGHRVYGEMLRFDAQGRYRGSEALLDDGARSIPEGRR